MKKIPNIFKPKKNYELVRLGKKNDGGYLLGNNTLDNVSCLISLGIALDASFEEDFFKRTNKKVFMYDKFHFKYYFKNDFLLSLNTLRNFKIYEPISILKKFFKLKKFAKKNYFYVKHISYNSLSNIIETFNFDGKFLIKIDIEGSEYRVLDCLLKKQNKIECIIIEFHDIDLHQDKIINFIKLFKLNLTHTHANNFGIADQYNNPTVLEMTFEKNPKIINKKIIIPHKLDMKNNPIKKDFNNYFK